MAKGAGGAERAVPDSKTCLSCGRTIEWRKKWERVWDDVGYCSDACRRSKRDSVDRALEASIRRLLLERATGATICPSEAAKVVGGADARDWRPLMEPARRAARRLVVAGEIDITQRGSVVDGSTAKGPIRLRVRRS